MTKYKLLLAEDNIDFSQMLIQYLTLSNFEVELAQDGEESLQKMGSSQFDLCLLDIMMPKLDGFTLAQEIQKTHPTLPFIFLTAKGLKEDRIKGLKMGADDYITKPFDPEELVLRIHRILQRVNPEPETKTQLGDVILKTDTMTISCNNQSHPITKMELDLFSIFLQNPNQVVERKEILQTVWGDEDYFIGRSMDVFVSRFRKYISCDQSLNLRTIRGIGYILESGQTTR